MKCSLLAKTIFCFYQGKYCNKSYSFLFLRLISEKYVFIFILKWKDYTVFSGRLNYSITLIYIFLMVLIRHLRTLLTLSRVKVSNIYLVLQYYNHLDLLFSLRCYYYRGESMASGDRQTCVQILPPPSVC